MINVSVEKDLNITSEDMYAIFNCAKDIAELDGFVSSFIFERSMYIYAAIVLYPERKEEIMEIASKDMFNAWQELLNDGTLEKMQDEFKVELDTLCQEGQKWFDEYVAYSKSARALLGVIQSLSDVIVEQTAKRFQEASSDKKASTILDIADKWGMNNPAQ